MEEKIVVYADDVNVYNCQVWKYVHGSWWYSGEGKFCKNLEQVMEYAKKRNLLLEFK